MAQVALAESLSMALASMVQAKVNELGWGEGGDNTDLAEYIILMLNTGKDQASLTHELAMDLLNLDPKSPVVHGFVAWLFQQVELLQAEANASAATAAAVATAAAAPPLSSSAPGADAQASSDAQANVASTDMDTDMNAQSEITAPTGPRSMRSVPNQRGGPGGGGIGRDKRTFVGQINRAMDRTPDSVLHRVRGSGNERIGGHRVTGPPTGPRGSHQNNRLPRNINGRAANIISHGIATQGMVGANMHMNIPHQQGLPAMNAGMNNINGSPGPWMMAGHPAAPQDPQQMNMVAVLEQQSRLIQQLHHQQQMMINRNQHGGRGGGNNGRAGFKNNGNQGGRGGASANGRHNNGNAQHQHQQQHQQVDHIIKSDGLEIEDVDMSQANTNPEETVCKFNLRCTNKDCKFAHQSPAAPPGITMDVADVCTFGAACKNKKCVGRHPSPATRMAHQSEQDCKFYPNCTNPHCQFRHPPPPCRNGGDCTVPNCKFTHLETACKFKPCKNRFCKFKHEDNQKGQFNDKVWVAGEVKDGQSPQSQPSISDRKFVDEKADEEMVIPGTAVEVAHDEALEIS